MEEADSAEDVAADEVVVSPNNSSPLFHLLMGLTRPLVGGFTSSNSAPLGGNRRW
jgi:hypothetical protein